VLEAAVWDVVGFMRLQSAKEGSRDLNMTTSETIRHSQLTCSEDE